MNVIFKGVDELTPVVQKINQHLSSINTSVEKVSHGFTLLRGVMQGVAQGIGQAVWFNFTRVLSDIARAIPNLIDRGKQWLTTVDQVADVTGLAADKASILAAQATQLEVPIDSLGTLFARFTQNLRPQEALLKSLGVSIKDASGNTRDAASIFYDLQRAIASSNSGVDRATVLAKLFGRGWRDAADLLTATPATLDAIAQHAQQAGLVASNAALQIRQDFVRTQIALQGSISGLGTQIFTTIAPSLTSLVNAIRVAIDNNMAQITAFVSRVAGFIVGVVSGLFGLNLNVANFAAGAPVATQGAVDLGNALDAAGNKAAGASARIDGLQSRIKAIDAQIKAIDRRDQASQAADQRAKLVQAIADAKKGADATDAYTKKIDAQTAAIDRQLAAMDKRNAAADEERQREDLVNQIGDLQSQLEDLKGQAVFTAGMSALEAELARQNQAQAIVDKQKEISDAQTNLATHDKQVHDAALRQQLEDERAALEKRKQMHQTEIADAKRVQQAMEALRQFDHQQTVTHQKQNLEDLKQNLQDQIAAIQKAQKGAGAGPGLKLPPIKPGDISAPLAIGISDAMKTALGQGSSFAHDLREFLFGKTNIDRSGIKVNPDGTAHGTATTTQSPGLIAKIDGLVSSLATFWNTTLQPIWKVMNDLTQPLKDLLGPAGFATLFVLWKTGIIPTMTSLTLKIGTLIASIAGSLFRPGGNAPGGPNSPVPAPGAKAPPGSAPGERVAPEEPGLPRAPVGEPGLGNLGAVPMTLLTLWGLGQRGEQAPGPDYHMEHGQWVKNSTKAIAQGQISPFGVSSTGTFNPAVSPAQAQAQAFMQAFNGFLGPGSPLFGLLYDSADSSSRTAEDTSRGADAAESNVPHAARAADAAERTRDNTAAANTYADHIDRQSKATIDKLNLGIKATVPGQVTVAPTSAGFPISKINAALGLAPGTNVNANVPGQVTVAPPTAGFAISKINAALGLVPGTTVNANVSNPRLPVDPGQVTVTPPAAGFSITKINAALQLDPATAVGVKGSVPVTAPTAGLAISKINAALQLDPLTNVGVKGQVPVYTQNGTVDVGNTGPMPLLRSNLNAIAGNTFMLSKVDLNQGRIVTTTTGGAPVGGGGTCFTFSTPICTPYGTKPIGEVQVGDEVWAVDEATLELVVSTVIALIPHPAGTERRLIVRLAGGTQFEVTEGHPFYDARRRRFHPIGEFKVGDLVLDYNSGAAVERAIVALEDLGSEPKDVYNFEVAVHHNYLANGVLVHNVAKGMGGVGLTSGMTELTIGEAGREAAAILRGPRAVALARGQGLGGAFGGGVTERGTLLIEVPLDGDVIGRAAVKYIIRDGSLSTSLASN